MSYMYRDRAAEKVAQLEQEVRMLQQFATVAIAQIELLVDYLGLEYDGRVGPNGNNMIIKKKGENEQSH